MTTPRSWTFGIRAASSRVNVRTSKARVSGAAALELGRGVGSAPGWAAPADASTSRTSSGWQGPTPRFTAISFSFREDKRAAAIDPANEDSW